MRPGEQPLSGYPTTYRRRWGAGGRITGAYFGPGGFPGRISGAPSQDGDDGLPVVAGDGVECECAGVPVANSDGVELCDVHLDEQHSVVGQPRLRIGDQRLDVIEAVHPSGEGTSGLVVARFRGEQIEGVLGNVRRDGSDHLDAAAKRRGYRVEADPVMDLRAIGQVSAGMDERVGGDVSGVHLRAVDRRGHGRGDRCHPAERLEDNWFSSLRRSRDGFSRQQQRPLSRHEHTRSDAEPETSELHPAEQVFERFTRDPASEQIVEFGCEGVSTEQLGLVLGEYAAGTTKCNHQRVVDETRRLHMSVRKVWSHPS